jgi:hypothetical protein
VRRRDAARRRGQQREVADRRPGCPR